MKKTFKFLFFIFTITFIIYNTKEIISSINYSYSLCFKYLFPSLIPFMFLSDILIRYNFFDDFNDTFKFITEKIFKINKNCFFVFIMSFISGCPNNAKYLSNLFENKLINNNDIKKCLCFCHFFNPIFILNTIGIVFLNNKEMGLIILISNFISCIFIGLYNRNKLPNIYSDNKINKRKKKSFITIINDSIYNTINTLLLILGIITLCLVLTCIINKFIDINPNYKFIYGFIEITQGLNFLAQSNINLYYKTIISSFFISFGGLCIHLQVFSIINNKSINYFKYFKVRVLHGILSVIITTILIRLFH